MILLDAYALVAFLAGERAAAEVGSLLRAGDVAIPAPNLAETLDVLQRVRGHSRSAVDGALEPLLATVLRVIPADESEARLTATLRVKHYDKKTSPLSLADCFLLAIAKAARASLATSDPPLAAAARTEDVTCKALPDSRGRRP